MGVYHIAYSEGQNEVCLYFDKGCNFSCHGCITRFHSLDCHLDEKQIVCKNETLPFGRVIDLIKELAFKKAIFLGLEPTLDPDFFILAAELKKDFFTYNVLISNGYNYLEADIVDEICVSIKSVSKELFRDFTGCCKPEQVLENFKRYAASPKRKVRAESVFIPGYIDKREIEKIARYIAGVNPSIPYRIDGYIPTDTYSENKDIFRAPVSAELMDAKMTAEKYLKDVSVLYKGIKQKSAFKKIY